MNLRERRRQQTADEIQQAALRLAHRQGFDAVTTEAIAAEAGISPRTFFNYFPNKQAAVLGCPPRLDQACMRWMVTSDAPLLDDLVKLLSSLFTDDRPLDRMKIRMIRDLLAASPELEPLLHDMLDANTVILTALLQERFGPSHMAEADLVARLATGALSHAVLAWACHDSLPQDRIEVLLRERLLSACRLICP